MVFHPAVFEFDSENRKTAVSRDGLLLCNVVRWQLFYYKQHEMLYVVKCEELVN